MISRDRVRARVGVVVTLAIVVPLGVMWWNSRLPSSYTVMDMGEMVYGGGPKPMSRRHGSMQMAAASVSVAELDTPKDRKADVVVDLDLGPIRQRDPATRKWSRRSGAWHVVVDQVSPERPESGRAARLFP